MFIDCGWVKLPGGRVVVGGIVALWGLVLRGFKLSIRDGRAVFLKVLRG